MRSHNQWALKQDWTPSLCEPEVRLPPHGYSIALWGRLFNTASLGVFIYKKEITTLHSWPGGRVKWGNVTCAWLPGGFSPWTLLHFPNLRRTFQLHPAWLQKLCQEANVYRVSPSIIHLKKKVFHYILWCHSKVRGHHYEKRVWHLLHFRGSILIPFLSCSGFSGSSCPRPHLPHKMLLPRPSAASAKLEVETVWVGKTSLWDGRRREFSTTQDLAGKRN